MSMSFKTITPVELNQIKEKGSAINIIDVRTEAEYAEVHAVPTLNIPLDIFMPEDLTTKHGFSKDDPVYLICRSGARSQMACRACSDAGFKTVYNVTGGTIEWVNSGLPTSSNNHQ